MGRTTVTKKRKKKAMGSRRIREERGGKKKSCPFTKAGVDEIDYKNAEILRGFMSEKGKIRPGRTTGVSRRHQNQLATAIKRARQVALLPYADK